MGEVEEQGRGGVVAVVGPGLDEAVQGLAVVVEVEDIDGGHVVVGIARPLAVLGRAAA